MRPASAVDPLQVVYSRGPLLWQAYTSPGTVLTAKRNKASQDFGPVRRTVLNKGELLGSKLFVTAEGTYQPKVSIQAVRV
jgi:hypothetical protein